MGLADQEPAVLVEDVIIPQIGAWEARVIAAHLRQRLTASPK